MRERRIPVMRAILAAGGLLAVPTPGGAQSEPATLAAIEVIRPKIVDDDLKWSIASAVVHFSLHHRLGDNLVLVAELPLARAGVEPRGEQIFFDASSSFAIGNPYIGIQLPILTNVRGSFGGTLPIAKSYGDDDFAIGYGMFSNPERLWAFFPDMLSLSGELDGRWETLSGMFGTLRLGSTFARNVGGDEMGDDTEVFGHYGAGLGYRHDLTEVAAQFSGTKLMTEEDEDNRALRFARVAASHRIGRVRPELYLKVPVTEQLRESVRYMAGVKVGVQLR